MANKKTPAIYINGPRAQKGALLVISLLLLAIMTILGITGMSNTTLEEKMSGNTRDLQLAFNAAEAGLRDAQSLLQVASLPPFNNTNGYYQPDTTLWKDPTNTLWSDNSKVITASTTIPGVTAQPVYYLEELPATNFGGSLEAGTALSAGTYRITTRAVGGSDTAVVILQETFRR